MARKRKSKYTVRANGLLTTKRTYNGKVKSFYGRTDDEIDEKIKAYELGLEECSRVRTIAKVIADYWELKEPELSPNTVRSYLIPLERIKAEWGDLPVDKLTVQEIYNFLYRFKIQGYSTKIISNTRCVLKGVLDNAIIKGEISRNPCRELPPISGAPKQKRKPAAENDVAKLVEHKTDNAMTRFYFLALTTGLRRGELVALKYKDIDLDKKQLHVVRSCAWEMDGTPVIKTPKTEAGIRTVDLIDDAIEILLPLGKAEDYIFFPDGLPQQSALEYKIIKLRKALGITSTPHQFRHSFASWLHSAGVSAFDAQHELGHSNIAVTLDVYTALEDAKRKQLNEQLNEYVKKNPFGK